MAQTPNHREAKAPPGIRRSNEQWQARALDGPGLYSFLEEAYPAYPALKTFEDDARPLPVWAEVGSEGAVGRNRGGAWGAGGLGGRSRCVVLGLLRAMRPPGRSRLPPAGRRLGAAGEGDPGGPAGAPGHVEPAHVRPEDDREERPEVALQDGDLLHSLATSESLTDEILDAYAGLAGLHPRGGMAQAGAPGLAAQAGGREGCTRTVMAERCVECHPVSVHGKANRQALDEGPLHDPEDLEMQHRVGGTGCWPSRCSGPG
jgi:hypothetical protein